MTDLFALTADEIQQQCRGTPNTLACIDVKGRSERTMQRYCKQGKVECIKDKDGNYAIPDKVIASLAKENKRKAELQAKMCENILRQMSPSDVI